MITTEEEEGEYNPLTRQQEDAAIAGALPFILDQLAIIKRILNRRREASPESASRPPAQQGQARAPQKRKQSTRPPGIPADALTIPEVAGRLGVHERTVYNLIARRELRSIRIGRCRRVLLADLKAFMEAHRS